MALIPNNENLVLGRGEVYFDRFVGSTGEGERYLGNTPSFQITRTLTRKDRKTSYGGNVHTQPGKVLGEEISIKITTDAVSWDNINEWFSQSSPGQATLPGNELVPLTEQFRIKQGRWYQLGLGATPMGVDRVDRMSAVRFLGGNPFREGVDWVTDRENGRFYIPVGSPRALDGSSPLVTYFRRPSGQFRTGTTSSENLGALRYISKNPYGPKTNFYFPMVRLTPQGDWEMKGDEFQQMQFSGEVIKLSPLHALMYAARNGTSPVAITADTTLITADTTLYTADNGAWTT